MRNWNRGLISWSAKPQLSLLIGDDGGSCLPFDPATFVQEIKQFLAKLSHDMLVGSKSVKI